MREADPLSQARKLLASDSATTEDRESIAEMINGLPPAKIKSQRQDVRAVLQLLGDRSLFTQQLQWDLHVVAVRVGLEERREPSQDLLTEQQDRAVEVNLAIRQFQKELLKALAEAGYPESDRPIITSRTIFGRWMKRPGELRYHVYSDTVPVKTQNEYEDKWRSYFLTVDGVPVDDEGQPEPAFAPLRGVLGLFSIAVRHGIRLPVPEVLRTHPDWPER